MISVSISKFCQFIVLSSIHLMLANASSILFQETEHPEDESLCLDTINAGFRHHISQPISHTVEVKKFIAQNFL